MKKKQNDNIVDGSFFERDSSIPLHELVDLTNNEIEQDKIASVKNIELYGNKLLSEINEKKQKNLNKRKKLINKIMKYNDNYLYDELFELTYHDLKKIYIDIIENRKSKIRRIFEFFLNPQ